MLSWIINDTLDRVGIPKATEGIMIKLTRIDHINMRVKNLEASKDFYGSVFGFEPKESGTYKGRSWAILGIPDQAYLCLYEAGNTERVDQDIQINHFGFHVEDFEKLERRLQENNVKISYGGAVQNGKSRSIYIEDPSGYEIELSEQLGGGLH